MARGIFTLKHQLQGVIDGSWSPYIAPKSVEYLVVAGAGGGANGGGGAGGLLQGDIPVTSNTSYTVTVGAGGTGGQSTATDGQNSVFGSIVAFGGGRGSQGVSGYLADVAGGAYSGGSGGGAFNNSVPGNGTVGQGNRGGNNGYGSPSSTAGGGGGAGTIGLNTLINYVGASGGVGVASAISGTVTNYAGGGAGGGYQSVGLGGAGGGGNAGFAGTPNTGGGGGGYRQDPGNLDGGAGGSGIVIVRYPGNIQFYTGGTLNYSNGFMVHTFYSSGTLAPTTPRLFASPDYQIARSLRFNKSDSTYLNRTPASAGNRKTWTYSGWVKLSGIPTTANDPVPIFGAMSAANDSGFFTLGFLNEVICIQLWNTVFRRTTAVYRDYSAWYHIVVSFDTTQATAANRLKLYVNGVEVTAFSTSNDPTINTDYPINNNIVHNMFKDQASNYIGGYLAEVNFVDGLQLTPASFGYTEPSTGVWTPLQYTGSYGTNGFYLNFADNSNTTAATLGKDLSGNGNNWTPNNFSVTAGVGNDSLLDSPTNYGTDTGAGGEVRGNYATLNPLATSQLLGQYTISNGNLAITSSDTSQSYIPATIGLPTSNKYYFEYACTNPDGGQRRDCVGLAKTTATSWLGSTDSIGYDCFEGKVNNNGTIGIANYATWNNGDIISVAVDCSTGNIWFAKNGSWQAGDPSAGTGATITLSNISQYTFAVGTRAGGAAGYTVKGSVNFGQRPFAYTAPSGYKALCTQNLPESGAGKLPGNYFGVAAYAANGGNQRPIFTGVDMTTYGGLAWFKSRNVIAIHYLIDTVRGLTKYLIPNDTTAEDTFDSGSVVKPYGLDINSGSVAINQPLQGYNYVMWNWAAGGAAVTNTQGSLTSQVSANPAAGFSIVTYTGNPAAEKTVGHGLNAIPKMILLKARNATANWLVYHESIGRDTYLILNTTAAVAGTISNYWGSSGPTTTTFGLIGGGYGNNNSSNFVAYCWAEVPGFSRISSYTGNGAADGPFVYTGFRPRWIMIKSTDTESWGIWDSVRNDYNFADDFLLAQSNAAEQNGPQGVDFLSNGFKVRGNYAINNTSGQAYIFAAYAESPLKYSRAR
jgi:hypothetical protein